MFLPFDVSLHIGIMLYVYSLLVHGKDYNILYIWTTYTMNELVTDMPLRFCKLIWFL